MFIYPFPLHRRANGSAVRGRAYVVVNRYDHEGIRESYRTMRLAGIGRDETRCIVLNLLDVQTRFQGR